MGLPHGCDFDWLDHMTSAAPISAPARATSPPNAVLRAREGARPVAAPDEAAAEVLEVEEVAEEDVAVLDVVVAFPETILISLKYTDRLERMTYLMHTRLVEVLVPERHQSRYS